MIGWLFRACVQIFYSHVVPCTARVRLMENANFCCIHRARLAQAFCIARARLWLCFSQPITHRSHLRARLTQNQATNQLVPCPICICQSAWLASPFLQKSSSRKLSSLRSVRMRLGRITHRNSRVETELAKFRSCMIEQSRSIKNFLNLALLRMSTYIKDTGIISEIKTDVTCQGLSYTAMHRRAYGSIRVACNGMIDRSCVD